MILRLAIQVAVMCLLGWWLCDIRPDHLYYWYSGIWQGIFFPVNLVRHFFSHHVLFKATDYTAAYNIFYWIFAILSTSSFVIGPAKRRS